MTPYDEGEDPNTPGSPGWLLHRQMEQAERQGEIVSQACVELRQRPGPDTADAYLEALQNLSRELDELQPELNFGGNQDVSDLWHKLTRVVTGEEQPV